MIIGYARVSTKDQNLDMQIQAIKDYAAERGMKYRIFQEKESGGKKERKELEYALDFLSEGDSFVVYKIDRMARSTRHLAEIIEKIEDKKANFVSLQNKGMDTTEPTGKLLFTILGGVAEFELEIIKERTQEGLKAARRRGKVGGRPVIEEDTKRMVRRLFESGDSATDIAKEFGIGRSTVYKILNEEKEQSK